MNFFRNFCLVIITLRSFTIYAQQRDSVSLSFGDEYEMKRNYDDLGFAGNETDGYIQMGHYAHKGFTIQKFSADNRLEGEKKESLDGMPENYESEVQITVPAGHYWLFSSWEDNGHRETERTLYAQPIDFKNYQFAGKPIPLLTTSKIRYNFESYLNNEKALDGLNYAFYYSRDKSKLLIKYTKPVTERDIENQKDIMGLCVINTTSSKLPVIWKQEVVMPHSEEDMDIDDYLVDNAGDVFIIAKVYQKGIAEKSKAPIYLYELYKWNAENTTRQQTNIELEEGYIRHAYLQENTDGKIAIAGYYSNQKDQNIRERPEALSPEEFNMILPGMARGAFVITIKNRKDSIEEWSRKFYEFPSEIIKANERSWQKATFKRMEELHDLEAINLRLQDFTIQDDGTVTIVGEQYERTGSNFYFGYQHAAKTTYYSDIYILSINKDGEQNWVQKIPKTQTCVSPKFVLKQDGWKPYEDFISSGTLHRPQLSLSFKSFYRNGDMYVLFLDNPKNNKIDFADQPAVYSLSTSCILKFFKINAQGVVTPVSLDMEDQKLLIAPYYLQSLGSNKWVGRAETITKYKPVVVGFH